MSNSFVMYPTIDENLFDLMGITLNNVKFFFLNEEGEIEIDDIERENMSYQIVSTLTGYSPQKNELIIEVELEITDVRHLFGEEGVTNAFGVLGIALHWYSVSSSQRGSCKIHEIHPMDKKVLVNYRKKINASEFRGVVDFNFSIYLESMKPNFLDEFYCNTPGTIFGQFLPFKLIFDGRGSMFPITVESRPNAPLWRVLMEFGDICNETFTSEYLQICLNSAHPQFQIINEGLSIKKSPLLIEIISSALVIIVDEIKSDQNDWENILSGNYQEGSIAAAIHYFLTTFEWDVSSLNKLSYSIRNTLNEKIGR
ncbi:hypothetical protein EDD63_1066 [Breznakia blatticola]|uniref:Uncharacterized protein n=1 Tax=Breznakia blatticola TaxID=1754012 RepID=A0A4R8A434_9FIRM|nr:hypothetical protein [Breznakia blatticola]TDW25065.1 hypothetical protein EDD63_1066 [Breznakia blatticola]